jgi:CheY-specific phosphatase CheX
MTEYHKKLIELFNSSANDFFLSTGVTDVALVSGELPKEAVERGQLFSSSLGFASAKVKGVVVITTQSAVIDATNPQREYIPVFSDADRADWVGEMANQIVGNLKRFLAKYKVDFSLSTPTVICGKDLAVANVAKSQLYVVEFAVVGKKVKLCYSAEFSVPVDFDVSVSAEPEQVAGGDGLFF